MSFLNKYKWFLGALLLTGICPLRYNSRTKTVHACFKAYIYSMAYIVFFSNFFIVLFTLRVITNPARLRIIKGIANALQGVAGGLIHFVLLLYCVHHRTDHAQFLNDIVQFDRKHSAQLSHHPIDGSQFVMQMLLHTFGYTSIYLTIQIWGDSMTFDLLPLWHNQLFKICGILFMTSRCMIALHLRFCSILMQQRRHLVRHLFASAQRTGDAAMFRIHLNLMKDLCDLKRSFERTFGFAIMLNMFNDFMLLVVLVYMSLMYVRTSVVFEWSRLVKLMCMFSLPCGKMVLFITGVDGQGDSRIRDLSGRHSRDAKWESVNSIKLLDCKN